MNNKTKVVVASVAIAMFMMTPLRAKEGEGHKHHKQHGKEMHGYCPMKVEGAKVHVENTKNGATIHITSEDSKVVKEIQEKCAKMQEHHSQMKQESKSEKKGPAEMAKYICPMKCEGEKTYDKPGKCPKCNMNLEKKK